MCCLCPTKLCFLIFCTADAVLNFGFMVYMSTVILSDHSTEGFLGAVILVALCTVVFLISFIGCWAMMVKSPFFAWSYTILLGSILAGKIALYVLIFHKINARDEAAVAIENSWQLQKEGNNTMDQYQGTLQCCGVDGPYDYIENKMQIPKSCLNTTKTDSTEEKVYRTGCRNVLSELLEVVIYWYLVFFWLCLAFDLMCFKFAFSISFGLIC